jgi:Zn-dependent peptidase ImmA (M78 family)/transcriptional regulator with XRE-family HTH domain
MAWNGAALEFARRDAGLTHQELIDELGWTVQPAAISRYESDTRTPSDDQMSELAKYFSVTEEYFTFPESPHGALATEAHMRRQQSERPAIWGRIEAKLVRYRRHLTMLMRSASFRPMFVVPRIDPIDTSPEEAARFVRAMWRMPVGPVQSMVRLLEAAGCFVIFEDLGTRRIDGMSIWGAAWPVVIVNSTMPPDRMRLTLAHELGHLVMHDGYVSFDPEVDANKFAAEFLMPESTIAPELRKSRLDLGALADFKMEWRVSMQALFERARSLGYADDDDRRRFYIAMNKRGWKVSEPNGEYCTEPSPRLLGSVLEQMASGGYDATDIAKVSGYAELPPPFAVEGRGGLRLV